MHIFLLFVGHRKIKHDSKRCSLSLLTLTIYGSSYNVDHLLSNRKAKSRSLNTVDTAVYLA